MRKNVQLVGTGLLLLALMLAGCSTAGTGGAGEQELISQGEIIYAETCSGCHGAEGQGGRGLAHAGSSFVTADDPAPVIETVLEGRGGMPSFAGRLTDEEVAAVISYMRNAWSNDASVVTAERVAAVRE